MVPKSSTLCEMKHSLLLTGCALVIVGCTNEPEVTITDPPSAPGAYVMASASSASVAVGSFSSASSTAAVSSEKQTSSKPSVNSLTIAVPFAVQAPFANWDALHEETCEEAALLMVERFVTGKGAITEQETEDELQKIVAWETDHGYGWDVTAEQILQIAKDYYGLDGRIETDVSEEHIKELLSQGYPIIIPAAGRMLGNPYFSGEGPWYHMLTIIGFDGNTAITNDPGTKRGAGYRYPFSTLIGAIHDWTGVKEETASGTPRMVVLWK